MPNLYHVIFHFVASHFLARPSAAEQFKERITTAISRHLELGNFLCDNRFSNRSFSSFRSSLLRLDREISRWMGASGEKRPDLRRYPPSWSGVSLLFLFQILLFCELPCRKPFRGLLDSSLCMQPVPPVWQQPPASIRRGEKTHGSRVRVSFNPPYEAPFCHGLY